MLFGVHITILLRALTHRSIVPNTPPTSAVILQYFATEKNLILTKP